MAAPTMESRIADDWLEVESAASVVSLPTDDESDDDAPVSSRAASPFVEPRSPVAESRLPLTESRSPPVEPAQSFQPVQPVKPVQTFQPAPQPLNRPHDAPPRYDTPIPYRPAPAPITIPVTHQPASLAADHRVKRAPLDLDDALEPDIYSAHDKDPSPRAFVNENAINDIQANPATSADNAANANNPSFYHKALRAAIDSLDVTIDKAVHFGASRISTLSFLKSACDDLVKHARDLEPILASYAKRWEARGSGMAAGEMPLNASLLAWITNLRVQLINAQAEMNRIQMPEGHGDTLDRRLTAKAIPLQINVALAGCTEALEDTLATIEEFMPIFKADFDESQTRWMNIPTKEVDDVDTPPRREPPHPDITRLRRELYSLKDQVRRSSVFLNLLCNTSPQPAIPGAPAVIQCLDGIVEAISTILTNHASDWIESDLDSRSKQFIPYHEFVALDPDVIHDVTGHLEELQDQLDVGEEQLVGTHTAEMIRNHQLVLLTECGQMAELASIADLLESLILHRA